MKGGTRKALKGGRMTTKQRNTLLGYLFILPWILGFFLFAVYPFLFSIIISMSNVKITPKGIETVWIGLQNYLDAFTKDVEFPVVLASSLTSVIFSTPLIVVISLIIALLLNRKFKGRGFFRTIFFLPVIIISGPVISELLANKAANIVDPTRYAIYKFFTTMPAAVGTPVLYVFDQLVVILWFSGVQILIFLAGLQKIDGSIYEAAQIDGASAWEVFWKIVLPHIKTLALVNAIYTIVEMASFPNNPVNMEISRKMFQVGIVYSYSASISWIYFLAELVLLGITFLMFKERKKARWKG